MDSCQGSAFPDCISVPRSFLREGIAPALRENALVLQVVGQGCQNHVHLSNNGFGLHPYQEASRVVEETIGAAFRLEKICDDAYS
eukprot:gene24344-biopygen2136